MRAVDTEKKTKQVTRNNQVWIYRLVIVNIVIVAIIYTENLQGCINNTWTYCLQSRFFNSVYFETWWQIICYLPTTAVIWTIDKIPFFDKYKIHPNVTWNGPGLLANVKEGIVYVIPLLSLDTFLVKKYPGVSPDEWITRRASLVQTTRALPVEPPTVFQIVYQLFIAFLVYDFLFAMFHYALHKDRRLYKYIHAVHHDHSELMARVVNQLSLIERIVLILCANESLKIINSHPLTRAIFVPVFVIWITDNHSGYDFPWGIQNIVPYGLIGGPVKHYAHHMKGDRYYAPFFTHMDKYVFNKLNLKNR